jgi:hypothetical protein
MSDQVLLTVVYTGEPDEVFEFHQEQQARTFGRDEIHCDIVIWSAINGSELSRVAGHIWRMGSELWVRNLSTKHELYLEMPGHPSVEPLPPRSVSAADPGWARSIPGPAAFVRAPGGCELDVRQQRTDAALPDSRLAGADTIHAPEIPERFRAVAAALCEPLLRGGRLPATYSEIAQRVGDPSVKRIRNIVANLCEPYLMEIPLLNEKALERRRCEQAELELIADTTVQHGVRVFRSNGAPPADDRDRARVRALALPDYYEVAHLLVRRHLITVADLARLSEATRERRSRP